MAGVSVACSSLYEEDVHLGTHLEVWGSWYDVDKQRWGFACCKSLEKKRRCSKTDPDGSDGEQTEIRVSARVASLIEQYPCFSGDVPAPEMERDWSDSELRNYIFSNGLIRPARRRGEQRAPPSAVDWRELQLEVGADAASVRKAYRRLALLHHPDKHTGAREKEKASQKFQRLASAYETVSGHIAEVPVMAAESGASRKRPWRIVVVQ